MDTTAYLFVRDGVFLQNTYWLLTYPDTDTTAARTCLTEGSSTAAVFFIKKVDERVLEPVSVRSLTPHRADKWAGVFTSCRTVKKKHRLHLENCDSQSGGKVGGDKEAGVGEAKKERGCMAQPLSWILVFVSD